MLDLEIIGRQTMKLPAGRHIAALIIAALIVAECGVLPSPASAQMQLPPGGCKAAYEGTLVVSKNNDGRTLTLTQSYGFGDANCTLWLVPKGAHTDGASIPKLFQPILGDPFDGKYLDAAVIHDWFCDRRTQPWQNVHRMFYEAMLVSGVEPSKAKVMYLAVYYQGPRWTKEAVINNRLVNPPLDGIGIDHAMMQRYKDISYSRKSAISAGVRHIYEQIKQKDVDLDQIDCLAEVARAKDGLSDAPPPSQVSDGAGCATRASRR